VTASVSVGTCAGYKLGFKKKKKKKKKRSGSEKKYTGIDGIGAVDLAIKF
jgi:hypothetical protein